MAYAQITPIIGEPQQGALNVIDTVQRAPLGLVIQAVDNYLGYGEFKYVAFPTSTAFSVGQLVHLQGYGVGAPNVILAPNTANTGRSIAVIINTVASNAAVQYGWVQISGECLIKAVASVAAGTSFGIDATTAGSVNAVSAGRQVLNAVSIAPSTTTVVKTNVQTQNGSPVIVAKDIDGWLVGLTMSGTGISGTILSVDTDNRTVTLSANATATGTITATATYTGFIVGLISRAFIQGAIT